MNEKQKNQFNIALKAINKKVFTLDDIVRFLNRSKRTVQRRIEHFKPFRSYNFNGQYFVLRDIPVFDQFGIWEFKQILFSRYGNLKDTFLQVVHQSPAGLNAIEISEIMHLNAHTFLSHFKEDPTLCRERHKGAYLYFSTDSKRYWEQKNEREKIIQSKAGYDLPSDSDSVIILVELIKHPHYSIQQLARRVRRKGISISEEKITNLLRYHDIVKKTPDSIS
jgi:hypothetical protein